jgi:hypothetical protein
MRGVSSSFKKVLGCHCTPFTLVLHRVSSSVMQKLGLVLFKRDNISFSRMMIPELSAQTRLSPPPAKQHETKNDGDNGPSRASD